MFFLRPLFSLVGFAVGFLQVVVLCLIVCGGVYWIVRWLFPQGIE
jgi:hypothetical protein